MGASAYIKFADVNMHIPDLSTNEQKAGDMNWILAIRLEEDDDKGGVKLL